ncbi:hypothetical protein OHW24_13025 [Acinetobacter baumannii]|nr:hypothetical protein [Acinetobacter baumannii]MDC5547843.1 hypothetical protein [Acinetobacter baumannii]MDX7929033.1 hypothetical protein [Acinetobacter baumannii]
MKGDISYPFSFEKMKKNLLFLIFCPVDELDSENRPVLENRSIKYTLKNTSFKKCYYEDSRLNNDKLMNVESLRSFVRNQEEIYEIIEKINKVIDSQLVNSAVSEVKKFFFLNFILYKSINYFFLKNTVVPATYSNMSRISQGIVSLLVEVSYEKQAKLDHLTINKTSIYEYANRKGFLISTKGVCAAPINMLKDYIGFLLKPESKRCFSSESVEKEITNIIYLTNIILKMELACIIYEAMRVKAWKKNNSENQPKSLFAIKYSQIAHKIGKEEAPFDNLLFTSIYNLYILPSQSDIENFKCLAEQLNNLLEQNKWDSHLEVALLNFREYSRKLFLNFANEFEKLGFNGNVQKDDFNIFFGEWPEF